MQEGTTNMSEKASKGVAKELADSPSVDLRGRIDSLSRELEKSTANLEEFIYIITHDLKEPLRNIKQYVSFLKEDCYDELGQEGQEYIEALTRICSWQEELMDNLLSYSRLGRIDWKIQGADIVKTIEEVSYLLTREHVDRKIDIEIVGEIPPAHCDASSVFELYRHLINNGIKYNRESEVIIRCGCKQEGQQHVYWVEDNGIGIKEDHQEEIFKIFRRLHPRSEFGGGKGFGLSLVKKIVDQHGGKIWLESSPGKGSLFSFTLSEQSINGGVS